MFKQLIGKQDSIINVDDSNRMGDSGDKRVQESQWRFARHGLGGLYSARFLGRLGVHGILVA